MATLTNPGLLVGQQIPEFLASDYPKFVEFLKAYYQFLAGYRYEIEQLRDVDQTPDPLVTFLRQEFASKFPAAQISERKLISIIRSLYRAKGTVNAIELLFRIFFNQAVVINQPGKNILRASDGQWTQEYSLTVEHKYGSIDYSVPIELKIENQFGIYYLETSRAEPIDATSTRFFYKSYRAITFDDPQYIDIVDSNQNILYRGLLVKSPSSLEVVVPGNKWKLGQVILVPGSQTPTIARVTQIGPLGEMVAVEVVEFGRAHTENQTVIVSPYPKKPVSTVATVVSTIVGLDGSTPIYDHQLELHSYIDTISESIYGLSTATGIDSYFLEDYWATSELPYNARLVVQQENETTGSSGAGLVNNPYLSLEQWFAARATLVYRYDNVVRHRGSYAGDRGQLSNTNIRLQDNYFYQLFSYVIESGLQIDQYRQVVNLIHPAGLKMFGELAKTSIIYNSELQVYRTISRNTVYLDHLVNAFAGEPTFDAIKALVEQAVAAIDSISSFEMQKAASESPAAIDQVSSKYYDKIVAEIGTAVDVVTKTTTNLLVDSGSTTDLTQFDQNKGLVELAAAIESAFAKQFVPGTFSETGTMVDSIALLIAVPTADLSSAIDLVMDFNLVKFVVESPFATDTSWAAAARSVTPDTATTTDTAGPMAINRPVTPDTADANDGSGTTSFELVEYSTGDYFAENYMTIDFSLTIG